MRNVAQTHQRGVIVDNDTGVLQADEGDEQADTGADGFLQGSGDGIQQPGAHLRNRQDDEDNTFNQHGREGELPAVSHAQAHREHEEGVQTHTGSQAKRFFGIQGHDQGTYDGGQGRSRKHRSAGHVKGTEDAGVDGQDIGHRQEGRNTRDNLCADIVLVGIKAK